MTRINGFLNVDELITLNNGYALRSEYPGYHYWINLGSDIYYYKGNLRSPYEEVICSELAKILGVDAVEYDLAIFRGHKGVISKSYRKEGYKYINGHQILEEYYKTYPNIVNEMGLNKLDWEGYGNKPWHLHMNNLMMIWQALEYKFPNADIQKLMNKILDQFIFMIITEQYDRGAQNWEIAVNDNEVDVVPIYDNESGFSGIKEVYGMTMSMSTDFDDFQGTISEVIKSFLSVSSSEFVNRFIELYRSLDEKLIEKVFENVENKIGTNIPDIIKDEVKENYFINLGKINIVLNELNLLNKGR